MDATGTALLAVGGVLAGAALTGIIQTASARIDRGRAARAAARLLYLELRSAGRALEELIELPSWELMITDWSQYGETWVRYQQALAVHLPTTEFMTVSSAFAGINSLRLSHDQSVERAEKFETVVDFDPTDEILVRYLAVIEKAETILLTTSFALTDADARENALRTDSDERRGRRESEQWLRAQKRMEEERSPAERQQRG